MGSDVFSRKCGAHNIIVPRHSSCPVCVSAKRSQLHAANLAHMPRYLFEQQLDVKSTPQGLPVRSYMKNPCKEVLLTPDKPCEVRWKVNFKSNYLAQSYAKLSSTTQALLMALDVTTDEKILKYRQQYQAQMASGATSPNDQDRLGHNLAIDMYHEIVRVSKGRIEDPERVTGEFVQYFRLLYGSGQRLIVDEPASKSAKYVLNFTSINDALNLNASTLQLIRKLDKYEGSLGKSRMEHQGYISQFTVGSETYEAALKHMAKALWNTLLKGEPVLYSPKVEEQFLSLVTHCYRKGQRLVEVQDPVPVTVPAVKPVRLPTYKLTLQSRNWHGHYELLQETQEAFRILEFGIPEVYQKWYALCEGVHKATTTVESMAYTMWDTVVKQHELRELKGDMAVRQDFVARFKYLYHTGVGQRIIIEETPTDTTRTQLPSVDDDLAGCLYNYLGTSSKELYHKQAILEMELAKQLINTREGLRARFRSLAHDTADAYCKDRMYDWQKIDNNVIRKLQERLADAYLEGKRR